MVVLLLPLTLAMDNSEFDHGGGAGNGSGSAATAVAAVAAVDDKDQWQWRLTAVAALDQGHATTSRYSKWPHNKKTRGQCKGRQHNNQLIFCPAANT